MIMILRITYFCIVLLISVQRIPAANVYVWPLGEGVFNTEIKGGASQGSIGDISIASGAPGLDYKALEFKGTASSYVELPIPSNAGLAEDSSFTFYLYLDRTTEGLLFHFRSDDVGASDALTEVIATFNAPNVMFEFDGESHTWSSGSDSISLTLPPSEWIHIAFSRDESNGNIELYINGASYSVDGGPKKIPLGLPGKIRLGYSAIAGENLDGRVACFRIQDRKFDYHSLTTDRQDCLSTNWLSSVPCSPDCSSYRGYFELTNIGKAALSFVPRLGTASDFTSTQCADICLANSACVSFMTRKSTGECELFAYDYADYLQVVDSGDSKYYVRKDKCCMSV